MKRFISSFALAVFVGTHVGGCAGSFGVSLTAAVTTDGVVDPEPPTSCSVSSAAGLGVFTVEPGNVGVSSSPFVIDAPYDETTLEVTVSVEDDVLAQESWDISDITPDFSDSITVSSGTSELVLTVKGVERCNR